MLLQKNAIVWFWFNHDIAYSLTRLSNFDRISKKDYSAKYANGSYQQKIPDTLRLFILAMKLLLSSLVIPEIDASLW